MTNTAFVTPMPAGYSFTAATKKAIAARDKAFKALQDYQLENADYVTISTPQGPRVPALVKAEAELRKLDMEAVRNGKPLTNRDEFLAPHKAKAGEYTRTIAALRASYNQAFKDAEEIIIEEMPTLARKALEECTKVHKEYVAAIEAAEDAKARMSAATSRLVWAVSDSQMDRSSGTGWADFSDAEAFEVTEDGRLTRRAAQSLGLESYENGSAVAYGELIDWNGAAPLHPRSEEVAKAIGNSPMDAVRAETVYDIARLSPEDYSRHFD
ncbi:hypothetical protein [Streptomyces sp. NPDC018972]|uniref:hypothetical protein n=1 Tax=Streptomyces sp. NPDC018972 TaxID=3365060 RepID=UPI0037903AB9